MPDERLVRCWVGEPELLHATNRLNSDLADEKEDAAVGSGEAAQ